MTPEDEARLRLAAGISPSTPTEYMLRHIPLWVRMSVLRGSLGGGCHTESVTTYDFTTNTYRKNGSTVYLGDVSEFIRLSSALMWQDGNLVEVQNNIARIGGDGLLLEDSATELIPDNSTITSTDTAWAATSKADTQIGNVFEFVSDGSTESIISNIPVYPNGNVSADSGYYYRSILAKKSTVDSFLMLGTPAQNSSIIVNLKNGSLEYSGERVVESKITEISEYYLIETLSTERGSTTRQSIFHASNDIGTGGTLGVPTNGHKVTVALPSFRDTAYLPQSIVKTTGTPVTRSPDILNIPRLSTQTITGDWDAGVTQSSAGGIATFTGHGRIRTITVEEL